MSEETSPTSHQPPATGVGDDEINLLDVAIVLAKHKKLVLGLPFAAALVAVVVSLLMTPIYTATTKLLPPQQNQTAASAILSQLDNIPGLAGAVSSGLKNPSDLYVGMLKSRTVADNLIQRFDLNRIYGIDLQSSARMELATLSKIVAGKEGIIVIEVDDEDPKRAAAIANGYAEELLKLTSVLAVTSASQRRLFFERQFAQTKESLAKAETAAREAIEKGGLANIDAQSRALLETTAALRAQIVAREVEISAMQTFASERNPDLVRTRDSLAAMRRELARIEGATQADSKGPMAGPSAGLDNVRLLRDVKYNEMLYGLLARQYELARIDEANDAGIVQVLDKAVIPDRKSKPRRSLIVILSTLVAGILGLSMAFILERTQRIHQNPQAHRKVTELRQYLKQ